MKILSFKKWLHESDEEGATRETILTSSFLIPILIFTLVSIGCHTIEFGVLPIAFIVQVLHVVFWYLVDSRYDD